LVTSKPAATNVGIAIKTKSAETAKLSDALLKELQHPDAPKSITDTVRVNIFTTRAMRAQWKGFAAIAGFDDMSAFIRFAVNDYIKRNPISMEKMGE